MTQQGTTRDIGVEMRHRVTPAGATRYGVVIAIGAYREKRLDLRCARADGQAIYDLMTDPEVGLFAKENVQLLLDENATREKIWRALSALRRAAGPSDTVWVYYAGHGAPEGDDTYWVTHDADVDDLYGTAIASREIRRVLGDIKAERLVNFVDCCHAAATTIQAHPVRDDGAAARTLAAFVGKGRITFSSSDGHEKSVELPEVGHGAFTHFLTRGLLGEADTDGAGVVTADKLWAYLHHNVSDASRRVGNPQTPKLIGELSHDLALTLNPAVASDRQRLAGAIAGHVGLGDHRLRTDEAEFCLDLLRRSPGSVAEKALLEDMALLAAGSMSVSVFRRLIDSARRGATAPVVVVPPVAPPPTPKPVNVAPAPSFADEVGRVVKSLKLHVDIDGPFTWDRYVQLARTLQALDGADPKSRPFLADADAFAAGRVSVTDFLSRLDAAPLGGTFVADLGGISMHFVRIKAGEFLMGSPPNEEGRSENEFQHKVQLTKPFMLGIHPVTRGQFSAFANDAAFQTDAEKENVKGASWRKPGFAQADDHPVVCVSWNDSVAFCEWLSRKHKKQYRLATEAEWEYACRAGMTTPFHTGATISTDQANYHGDYTYGNGVKGLYRKSTTPVGFFKPNAWGLFDMHGNIWEWCNDGYGEYPRQDTLNPAGNSDISSRVLRGGSWQNLPQICRAAYRNWFAPVCRDDDFGFRVALDFP